MLIRLFIALTVCSFVGFAQASQLDAHYKHKQATRSQIVDRRHGIHKRDPVPSSGTCSSGTKDGFNNCCKTASTVMVDNKACCTENGYLSCDAVQKGRTAPDLCCANGGTVYYGSSNNEDCCPATSKVEGKSCVAPSMRLAKRNTMMLEEYAPEDPLRTITFKKDFHRGILSPHLVADWIINDFEIEWQGQTYATKQFQQVHANWRKRMLTNIGASFAKYAGPYLIGDNLKRMYESGQEYFDLGHEWTVHLDDIPDVFAALVEHENWKGHVMLGQTIWDTDTFRNCLTKHPKWNSTLHDRR